jgi:predicted peptidase
MSQPGATATSIVRNLTFVCSDGFRLPWAYALPFGYDPSRYIYPVLMMQHRNGMGNPGAFSQMLDEWNTEVCTAQWRQQNPFILAMPACDQGSDDGNNVNFGGVNGNVPQGTHGSYVRELAKALRSNTNVPFNASVDPDRIHLYGQSMGAMGCWEGISRYNRFTGTDDRVYCGAMPMDGSINYEMPAYGGTPSQTRINNLRTVPLFVIHGSNDTTVNPSFDQAIFAAYGGTVKNGNVKTPNGNMYYIEVGGGGHGQWGTYDPVNSSNNWPWLRSL